MTRGADSRYSRQAASRRWARRAAANSKPRALPWSGLGALGSVQAELLARAGVGTLRLIDRDFVELSNLQRQTLYEESDAAEALPKAVAAARRLARVNSEVALEPMVADLSPRNIDETLEGVDLILDATDNFETRYLINDFAVRAKSPGFTAPRWELRIEARDRAGPHRVLPLRVSGAPAGRAADVRDRRRARPGNGGDRVAAGRRCAEDSGSRQKPRPSRDARLTTVDVWTGQIRQIAPPARDPDCPCCARREFPHLDGRHRAPISLCGRNAVQIHERSRPVDLAELASRLGALAAVRVNEFALRASLDPYELTVFPDGRAIIKGTTDTGVARSVYARYVGI